MKKIILLLTLFTITNVFSQGRIGHSFEAIKKDFSDYKNDIKYDDNGVKCFIVYAKTAYITYYFNNNDICFMTVVDLKGEYAIKKWVENYNEHYTIISSIKWKAYTKYGVMKIELNKDENDKYYFVWKKE